MTILQRYFTRKKFLILANKFLEKNIYFIACHLEIKVMTWLECIKTLAVLGLWKYIIVRQVGHCIIAFSPETSTEKIYIL